MTESKLTEEQQLLIAGYVLGQLDAEEAIAFARQIAEQPLLQQEVQRFQAALEAGFAPAEVTPSPHLKAAILAKAQAQSQVETTQVQQREQSPEIRLPAWVKGLGVMAILTIVGLSVSNFVLWRSAQRLRLALEKQPTLQITLEPTEADFPATATIAVDPNRLQATLTVRDLPPLPADKVYVLWTVLEANAAYTTDAKNAILTEVFTVDNQAQLSEEILVPRAFQDAGLVEAIAITIEDAAAPQRHESAPILIQQI